MTIEKYIEDKFDRALLCEDVGRRNDCPPGIGPRKMAEYHLSEAVRLDNCLREHGRKAAIAMVWEQTPAIARDLS